jgi:capsular polysaccharide biosynthesis protein
MIGGTSILEITAYDQNRQEAEKLAQAIVYVLTSEGSEYHGGGEDIIIKPVDTALTSDYPTRPNIILNIIASLFLGIICGGLIVYWNYSRKVY